MPEPGGVAWPSSSPIDRQELGAPSVWGPGLERQDWGQGFYCGFEVFVRLSVGWFLGLLCFVHTRHAQPH